MKTATTIPSSVRPKNTLKAVKLTKPAGVLMFLMAPRTDFAWKNINFDYCYIVKLWKDFGLDRVHDYYNFWAAEGKDGAEVCTILWLSKVSWELEANSRLPSEFLYILPNFTFENSFWYGYWTAWKTTVISKSRVYLWLCHLAKKSTMRLKKPTK